MPPGEPYRIASLVLKLLATLALFGGLFLAVFWTPGLLLGLFVAAIAADSRAFSQVLSRERRRAQLSELVRRYRGGWLDSVARSE
jgi:hypothetical protein